MADNKITITLDLENEQFTTKMNDAIVQSGEFKKAGDDVGGGWQMNALGMNAALELVGKAVELVSEGFRLMGEAIQEAAAHETDVFKLNQSLANSGQYSQEASDHFQELADSISKTSKFSESLVLSTAAVAARYTETETQTEKLTQAALKLSAATGIDAQTAVFRLGLSLEGIDARLSRTIPGLGKLTAEQLKHGDAIDYVMSKYPGLDNTLSTFSGRLDHIHNAWAKISVALGDIIVKSPIINRSLEILAELLEQAATAIKKFIDSGDLDRMIHQTINLAKSFAENVLPSLEIMYNEGKLVFDSFVLGFQTIIMSVINVANALVQILVPKLEFIVEQVAKVVGIFNKDLEKYIEETAQNISKSVTNNSQILADSTRDVMVKMAENVKEDWDNKFTTTFSDSLKKRLVELDHFADSAQGKLKKATFHEGPLAKPAGKEAETGTDEALLQEQENAKLRIIESGNYNIENAAKEHERVMLSFEDKRYKDAIKAFKESDDFKRGDYTRIESMEVQHQQNIARIQKQYTEVSTKNFELGWQGAMANMEKQFHNFATITQTLATKTHSIVSNGFIEMAKSHKFSMDQILNQFLSMIGETMIQWGTFDLLASIWPPNPVGLATGAALIAAGAVLVGVGSSATPSTPSATPGGAGSETGGIQSPNQAFGNQLQQKSAQVIIQGDFLNSTQTQQHLTDIIRQSSDVTDFAIVAQGKTF